MHKGKHLLQQSKMSMTISLINEQSSKFLWEKIKDLLLTTVKIFKIFRKINIALFLCKKKLATAILVYFGTNACMQAFESVFYGFKLISFNLESVCFVLKIISKSKRGRIFKLTCKKSSSVSKTNIKSASPDLLTPTLVMFPP